MNILSITALLVMLLLPAAIIALSRRVKLLHTIGAVALCYVAGLLLSLLPVSYDKGLTQTVASVAVALAIPLILFGFDLRSVRRLAKKTTLGMTMQFVAVAVSATLMCALAGPLLDLGEVAPLAGMAVGLYTGGTPNLVAIGNALLPASSAVSTITAANTADFVVGGVYFLFLLTAARPVYDKLLGRTKTPRLCIDEAEKSDLPQSIAAATSHDEYSIKHLIKDKKRLLKLSLCVLLAVACLGIGAVLEILINGNMDGSLFIMVSVSVLGLAFSFVPKIRAVEGTYSVGQYLILVFSLGLSMSLDLSALVRELLPILTFFAATQVMTILLHLILCKLCRIDAGTALITGTAGIYGPPFIAPVAGAYGDHSLIIPGVICGVFGLAVGNLVGIGLGSLLALLF